jgi:hypothetical protein
MAVGIQYELPSGESANQHQQGGLGKMEVGEQRAHYPKLKSGIDEDVSLAGSGLNPAGFASCVFQGSHRRGPYGHDSPMALERRVDRRGSLLRDRKMFFMKLMTFDHILPNWLKGSQTYMQGNLSRFNASFSQTT